jgi:tRNA(adenine34) deaminase
MIEQNSRDEKWMAMALELAKKAASHGDVPVGAVVVDSKGQLISWASNNRERLMTPLGHAEVLALHRASKKLKSWRLVGCTLYVTLEPCLMCAGAIQQARVDRVVYGAKDSKAGAVESLYSVLQDSRLNHQVELSSGVLKQECSLLLTDFFAHRRLAQRNLEAEKIYRKRASVVVIHKNKILGFHGVDPKSGESYFFLPGGKIENGESPHEAGIRETFEETGYKIKILHEPAFIRKYEFYWDGILNHCETSFFLGVLDQAWNEPKKIIDADYHRGVDWIPSNEVGRIFSYSKDILWATQKLIKIARKKGI